MTKSYFNIREALEIGTDKIVDAYKKATPGEVTEAPEDDWLIMPASPDEAGMAMDQAKFIGYVADEIMEYIQGNNEFPEWMQNKLSALHEKAKGMHAVMAGKYESVQEGKVECPKCKGEGCDHCDGKGYHMTEAKQKNWIVTVVKPINKLKKGMKVIVPARNTAEAMKKALKKMGENPAAIGSGHIDVKLAEELEEKYRAPTKAEIEADKKKDQKGKSRPSISAKSVNKKQYSNMMGRLKEEELDEIDLEEKLQVSDGMAKWIEDFQKSDAPQFVEKDKNERREMAIAAYLAAKRKSKKED